MAAQAPRRSRLRTLCLFAALAVVAQVVFLAEPPFAERLWRTTSSLTHFMLQAIAPAAASTRKEP